jgi:hypothetical protein
VSPETLAAVHYRNDREASLLMARAMGILAVVEGAYLAIVIALVALLADSFDSSRQLAAGTAAGFAMIGLGPAFEMCYFIGLRWMSSAPTSRSARRLVAEQSVGRRVDAVSFGLALQVGNVVVIVWG